MTELVIRLIKEDAVVDLGEEFRAALRSHAEAIVNSDHEIGGLADDWGLLPQALDSQNRHLLAADLCRVAVETRGNNMLAGYFRLYGAAMLDEEAMLGTEGLVADVFMPIVTHKTSRSAARKWMIAALTAFPSLTAKYKPRDDVSDLVKAAEKAARAPLLGKPDPSLVRIRSLLPNRK